MKNRLFSIAALVVVLAMSLSCGACGRCRCNGQHQAPPASAPAPVQARDLGEGAGGEKITTGSVQK